MSIRYLKHSVFKMPEEIDALYVERALTAEWKKLYEETKELSEKKR